MLRLDLQFFAQEKTEKATPQKRKESRKKGQVAKSAEIPSALIMLFVFLFLLMLGSWFGGILLNVFHLSLDQLDDWDLSQKNLQVLMERNVWETAKVLLPIMGIALVAGLFGNYIQIGFLFTTEPLKVKLNRINPIEGAKRIFSKRALVELLKTLLKITMVGSVVALILWNERDSIFTLPYMPLWNVLGFVATLSVKLGIYVALLLLVLSIFDYAYQRYEYEKNLRMSKQDIKDEYKKTEGDPLVKSRIKERQRQMAMQRMMQEVPKADVIITNPTHFAVALQYQEEFGAPKVIAKGQDYIALKIKTIAKEHEIMVIENKPLARALYFRVELGEFIPEDLFQAVAEVLAYVYRVKGQM
ncbi:flagellar biosynthesis protein FlhB [Rubeoparvulum massiliense]|uniref:flagellar biosynthesis protein FlhB n=1 Tax=Rubeoparvulum massiliense TaxID=1631346 RepID=UPI00065E9438|nr:flagellar biosynthesis protein FlhB [Rubeoparvulum massiliense]